MLLIIGTELPDHDSAQLASDDISRLLLNRLRILVGDEYSRVRAVEPRNLGLVVPVAWVAAQVILLKILISETACGCPSSGVPGSECRTGILLVEAIAGVAHALPPGADKSSSQN